MKGAALSPLGKLLRRPWYWFWHFLAKFFFQGRSYTIHVPFGDRVFTPWFDLDSSSNFAQIIRIVQANGPLVVSPDRCYLLYQLACQAAHLPGDMAECGVFTGGTAQILAEVLTRHHSSARLHLFDTFSGMPDTALPERDYHSPGDFSGTSLEFVRNRLRAYASSCEFHPGFMPDTFSEVVNVPQYSFVHIDVDIYLSVLACCEWFWPRLVPGGVMVFDDYGFYSYRHAAKAGVDEFFADKIEQSLVLPTGQALVIKSFSDNSEK
ncbi:MAG: TylF/MycF family methyltransferase [Chloroflexi bacterium]|nr:TylF/MycF family methyltransferase [Chloroflexota bacterium]MCI0725593.1 TylF/MycF family methyltransferase [Chloroflexota bacterium]